METLFVRHLLEAVSYLYYLKDDGSDFSPSWKKFLQSYLDGCPWYHSEEDLSYLENTIIHFQGEKPTKDVLQSIFPHLEREGKPFSPSQTSVYRAQPLIIGYASQQGLFVSDNAKSHLTTDFSKLWRIFAIQFSYLQSVSSIDAFTESLYNLLEAFASRVLAPEAGPNKDVSLYNWMRIKAAKEICDKQRSISSKAEPYLLLKGDFTGIQKFIYSRIDMSTAGNQGGLSKRLRGRSFYIALLTNYAADEIKRRLDLSVANILYTAGGHFLMILPNREGILEEIAVIKKELNLYLLQRLGGRVSLLLGQVACGPDLFDNTSTYYQKLGGAMSQLKFKKYHGYLDQIFDQSLSPILSSSELDPSQTDQFQDDHYLGLRLPYSGLLLCIETQNDEFRTPDELLRVAHLGYGEGPNARHIHYFMPGLEIPKENESLPYTINEVELRAIKKIVLDTAQQLKSGDIQRISISQFRPLKGDFQDNQETDALRSLIKATELETGVPVSFVFEPVGTDAPFNEHNVVADFDFLERMNARERNWKTPEGISWQPKEKDTLSYPLMAVMRLDIDDLGALFEKGLGKDHSFQRVATLSRELSFFFSSYFNVLARKWKIYVTYSGGDDAFVVGSWYNILHFAKELKKEFEKFVCHHPGITFSAGIFLCDSHYPVAKFAEMAAEAEENAKSYKSTKTDKVVKNAIHVFDHTLSWKRFDKMIDFGDRLLCILPEAEIMPPEESRYGLARSLVHKILRLIKGSLDRRGSLYPESLIRNTTQLKYMLARRGYGAKKMTMDLQNPEVLEELGNQIEALTIDIIQQYLAGYEDKNIKEQMVKDYLIPSQYVIMKTRKV
ncbi:MAG: hypothetical protein AAFW00_09880 [Bacteroidota bacterium]